MDPRYFRKALTAAVSAAAAAFIAARSDLAITTEEWIGIVSALVIAGVATYLVRNKQEPAPPTA